MATRQGRNIPWAGDELDTVVHLDRQPAADVVLKVRRLAAPGARDRLHVLRPAPAWLKHQPPDLAAANVEDLGATIWGTRGSRPPPGSSGAPSSPSVPPLRHVGQVR